jgi:ankyrin repeat protein
LKDINNSDLEKTFQGRTLLFSAATFGLYEVVSYLLDRGADANIRSKDKFSQAPLELISNTKSPLFNLLYKHTKKPSANDILFQKVLMGSLEDIKDAVAKGLPVDYQDSSGWTLLHWAASNNSEDIVRYLLELGANANKKTSDETSEIPLAFVQNTNSKLFKLLYKHTNKSLANVYRNTETDNIGDASPKCSFSDMELYINEGNEAEAIRKLKYLDKSCFTKTSQGQTLLYQALASGFGDLAALLMEQSSTINLNYQNSSGWTLLHWAAHYNFKDITATLLTMGTDPTLKTKDEYQQVPLDFVQDTKSDLFNLLYESTRSVDQSLADATLFAKISSSLSDYSLDFVKDALKKGLPVNYQDSVGWTLLHWAALNKREDIVSYLLEIGASSNTPSTEEIPQIPLDNVENTNSNLFELLYRHTDKSLININIQNKLLESAMVMVQQGDLEALSDNFEKLDLNMQDNRGWTLLHQAVICKKENIVAWLNENGADASIKTHNGKTASKLIVASPSKEPVSSTFSPRFDASKEQGDSPSNTMIEAMRSNLSTKGVLSIVKNDHVHILKWLNQYEHDEFLNIIKKIDLNAPNTALINESPQCRDFLKKTILEDFHNSIDRLGDRLDFMVKNIEEKKEKDPVKYTELYNAAFEMQQDFTNARNELKLSTNLTKDKLNNISDSLTKAIDKAQPTFSKHRGFGGFDSFIKGVLGVLAFITVIPALLVEKNSKDGYYSTFFDTKKTQSEEQLGRVSDTVSALKKELNDFKDPGGDKDQSLKSPKL